MNPLAVHAVLQILSPNETANPCQCLHATFVGQHILYNFVVFGPCLLKFFINTNPRCYENIETKALCLPLYPCSLHIAIQRSTPMLHEIV